MRDLSHHTTHLLYTVFVNIDDWVSKRNDIVKMSSGCDRNYGDACVESECRNNGPCLVSPLVNITCMQLIKSFNNRCRKSKAYGFSGDSIWVDNGCKANFNVCYTDGVTTEQTTPELTTILSTSLGDPDPDAISNSTTGARDDVGKVDGAVIGGAVCGAVVALVLIILMIVIVRHRTKSRYKKHNISQKSNPPVYDYAYGNCPEGSQNNLQSENKSANPNQIVIDCPDTKPPVSDHDEPTTTTDNLECGQPALDSSGYLLLDAPGTKTAQNSDVGNTYDYAYSEKHKRHSADDYVNARVTSVDVSDNPAKSRQSAGDYVNSRVISTVENDNAEYSLAKDPEVEQGDQSTEQLYEIPEPVVGKKPSEIENKLEVPLAGYSLAKQQLPVINIVPDTEKSKNLSEYLPKEYSLAKVPEKDNCPVPKRPEKNLVKEPTRIHDKTEFATNTNEESSSDNHIYQNTKVKQLIAKLNGPNSSENITDVKQTDESKQGKKNINRNGVTKAKSANINRELLQLGVPPLRNSNSDTQLDKKSNAKPKKALMPPTNRIKKSASTDALK